MNVEYISDTGSRHEWKCVHCDSDYVVTYHYLDSTWSVQRIRGDGEREILDRTEAERLLDEFPRDHALQLTDTGTAALAEADTTASADQTPVPGTFSKEATASTEGPDDGPLDLGDGPAQEDADDRADSDSTRPTA